MNQHDDPMQRWIREGYRPELLHTEEGWTVVFAPEGGLAPEWSDCTGLPIFQESPEAAVEAVCLDEQLAEEHRRSVERRSDPGLDT